MISTFLPLSLSSFSFYSYFTKNGNKEARSEYPFLLRNYDGEKGREEARGRGGVNAYIFKLKSRRLIDEMSENLGLRRDSSRKVIRAGDYTDKVVCKRLSATPTACGVAGGTSRALSPARMEGFRRS